MRSGMVSMTHLKSGTSHWRLFLQHRICHTSLLLAIGWMSCVQIKWATSLVCNMPSWVGVNLTAGWMKSAKRGGAMIVPVDFPEAIDVSDPYLTRLVSLSDMKDWEWAPHNPAKVAEAGIPMALTMHGVDKGGEFLANVRKAVAHGLNANQALDALTRVAGRDDWRFGQGRPFGCWFGGQLPRYGRAHF